MKQDQFGKVAVLMGGKSSEREVSLVSGKAALSALHRLGIDAEGVDTANDYIPQLINGGYERAFIALHGRGGEDGSIQGLLETIGLPYTGSGILASALAMDKYKTKRVWQSLGLPTPPAFLWNGSEDPADLVKSLGLPLSVKPNFEGSSIGVQKLTNFYGLYDACAEAAQYGSVLLEQWIIGDEITVGILGDRVLPSIHIVSHETFYDYHAKYHSNETEYRCPSELAPEEEARVCQLAQDAYQAVGASGWGRVDFIRDSNGDFWLLEVNTVPGLTSHSLVPTAAKTVGISFDELVYEILKSSLKRKEFVQRWNQSSLGLKETHEGG